MKTTGQHKFPEGFELSKKTLAWCAEKYPQVNVDDTFERFEEWARREGVMYADWDAGFKTVVRKGIDNGWRTIVTLKGGMAADPKFQLTLHEARKIGFRDPVQHETAGAYKTAFENYKRAPRPQNVLSFANVLKKAV